MQVKPTLEAIPDLPSAARRGFMKAAAGAVGILGVAGRFGVAPITPAAAESSAPADYKIFEVESVKLQSGTIFPNAKLAYKTYGELAPDKSNVIVFPSAYSGTHKDIEWQIAADKVLDPGRYFIIIVNMLSSEVSSSPGNAAPPFDRGHFPNVTLTDNVRMQYRLVTEVFGIKRSRSTMVGRRAGSTPTTGAHCFRIWSSGSVSSAARRGHQQTISCSSQGSKQRSRPIACGKTIGSLPHRCVAFRPSHGCMRGGC